MKKWLKKIRTHRMEKRGEVVLNERELWDFIKTLTSDILPDIRHEFSRNLFQILAFWWAVQADKRAERDPYQILRHIRGTAWQAYTDMPATLENIRKDFPDSPTRKGIISFFEEIKRKGSAYLFLPVVSSIDRHQTPGLPPVFQIDDLTHRMRSNGLVQEVMHVFSATPNSDRETAIYLLALFTQSWRTGQEIRTGPVVHKLAVIQLRLLYNDPEKALSKIAADASEYDMAEYFVAAGREISSPDNRLVLLETLFITEGAIAGPQSFDHAFEIQETEPEI